MQKMTFIFDTGSAWTWIPSKDCPDSQCSNNHYKYQFSSGFRSTNTLEDVKYGIGYIKGYVVNDDIAITSDTKSMATDVNFINVYEAKQLSTLESDGLLGLSPKTNRLTDDNIEVHLLINELKKDGIIDKALFAMYLTDYRKKSKMHFGGWDASILAESIKENK